MTTIYIGIAAASFACHLAGAASAPTFWNVAWAWRAAIFFASVMEGLAWPIFLPMSVYQGARIAAHSVLSERARDA